jgi:ribose transport system ATP-binding protein
MGSSIHEQGTTVSKRAILLDARNVTKTFAGIRALKGIDFQLRAGEVHILLGENGAGKSTLIKILSGAHGMDEGELFLEGQPLVIHNPNHARELGLFTIYQEFCLVPLLTVAENISLGSEPVFGGFIDKTREVEEAKVLLDKLGFDIDPKATVKDLEVPKKQMVEIAKALRSKGKLLMLDEPTAALTNKERDRLFEIIRQLKKEGVGITYISHRLEEVKMIGDRVTVLRDGKVMGTSDIGQNTEMDKLVQLMTGREITQKFPKVGYTRGEPILRVKGLTASPLLKNIDLTGYAGEILGIFGLPGCGSLELARILVGAATYETGSVEVQASNRPVAKASPAAALEAGINHLPPERKEEGLVLTMSLKHNVTLSSLRSFVRGLFIKDSEEKKQVKSLVASLDIKTPGMNTIVSNLSGGNQQKVVLAKALCRGAEIFIFCEPTRGIDVGTKVEIYQLMNELVQKGAFILMVSSELPEIVGMSDRILVMYKGQIVKEFSRSQAREDNVLEYAFGRNEDLTI